MWFGRENDENVVRTRDWCGWPSSPRTIVSEVLLILCGLPCTLIKIWISTPLLVHISFDFKLWTPLMTILHMFIDNFPFYSYMTISLENCFFCLLPFLFIDKPCYCERSLILLVFIVTKHIMIYILYS